MKIAKLIALYVVFLLFANHLRGNEAINIYLFNTDTIESVDNKIEYLIQTSIDLEKYSLTLSHDAISQAYTLSNKTENNILIAKCNYQQGKILSKLNQTDKALIALKAALKYYENNNDNNYTAKILIDIGNVYFHNSQYTKSIMYYNSALAEFTKLNDNLNIISCYTHLGQSNLSLGNIDEAIIDYRYAINISKINAFNYQLSYNYLKLVKLQLSSGLTDSVLYNVNIALNIAKQYQFDKLVADAYMLSSNYYYSVGNKERALIQMKKFIRLSDSTSKTRNTEFNHYINKIKNKELSSNNRSNNNISFWLITIVLIIVILFLLNKIVKLKILFKEQIYFITTELNAFEENSDNLNETIDNKTKERLNEIKGQIVENENIKLALKESLKNLNNINNLKDIFLSKISHEIRTPLSSILGFSEILETELALLEDSTLFEFANSISQSGQSLVLLLDNILDISKLDSNKMQLEFKQLNTKELIQGVVDKHYHEASLKGIKLIYASESIPDIQTDGQMFTKIISLILNNSVKFTEKGFIKISHFHDEKNNRIILTIKDTGIGIDKVYINQVFEPFRQESLGYSTSYQGAGLGLPLAKKMSIKLNGDIKIDSEKGSGTTITLSFPTFTINSQINTQKIVSESITDISLNKLPWDVLSILVVEDDNMNQILYRKLLKTARVLEIAKDGKSALSIIDKEITKNNFQLVLMDINLPTPWDGISLMKEIRKKWPEYKSIPFIAQTAYAISGNRDAMLDEGFDEYITKPILKSTLIETIEKVFNIQ
jgi:signal transduction histidine kinase/CheY-like chemotaxis protein